MCCGRDLLAKTIPLTQVRYEKRVRTLPLASVAVCRGRYSELLAASLAALAAQCRQILTSMVCPLLRNIDHRAPTGIEATCFLFKELKCTGCGIRAKARIFLW